MMFNSIKLKQVLIPVLFWGLSFYICLQVFSRADNVRVVDVIYTFLFHVPMVFAVTIHSLFLLPDYLAKSRFRTYGLLLLVLYCLSVLLYFITFDVISGWIFEGYYFVAIYSAWEVCGFLTIYLLLSSSLEFGRSWFGALQAKNKIMELESQKTASELKVLRAQI